MDPASLHCLPLCVILPTIQQKGGSIEPITEQTRQCVVRWLFLQQVME